jgi:hypothetical protein
LTPRDLLRESIQTVVAPALFGHGYSPGTDRLALQAGDLQVLVRFNGHRGNRGTQSKFTSSWWLSSRRLRSWRRARHPELHASGLLFARNDWLLPGWPIDPTGFYVTAEAAYDKPNIHSFVAAATTVAVPLFSSFSSAEAAASWALENLDFPSQTDLANFVNQSGPAK